MFQAKDMYMKKDIDNLLENLRYSEEEKTWSHKNKIQLPNNSDADDIRNAYNMIELMKIFTWMESKPHYWNLLEQKTNEKVRMCNVHVYVLI